MRVLRRSGQFSLKARPSTSTRPPFTGGETPWGQTPVLPAARRRQNPSDRRIGITTDAQNRVSGRNILEDYSRDHTATGRTRMFKKKQKIGIDPRSHHLVARYVSHDFHEQKLSARDSWVELQTTPVELD